MDKRLVVFRIGDWVRITAKVEFEYDDENERCVVRTPFEKPIVGQIVGARRKHLGKYHKGGYSYDHEDYEESFLEVKSSTWVWLVRDGLFNTPYQVQHEDVAIIIPALAPAYLPILKQDHFQWTESMRQDQRKWTAMIPRDSKGRWVKS